MKRIEKIIEVGEKELIFKTSRAGGSGGQHVNKVETKVTLNWNIKDSGVLTVQESELIREKLGKYIVKDHVLQLQSQNERSQLLNREIVIKRWKRLLRKAFVKPKVRKPTRPTAAGRRKRRKAKEQRSRLKESRKKPGLSD